MTDAVFDRAGVMSRLDNDTELFHELLGVFEEEWPKIIREIESGISTGNVENVTLHAHSLKGALGNVGAAQAATAAKTLEICGKGGDLTAAPKLVTDLVDAIQRFRKELRATGIPLGAGSD